MVKKKEVLILGGSGFIGYNLSNFLSKNLNNLFYEPSKIVCCAAIILSGMMFKENDLNYKIGIKELEKVEPYNKKKVKFLFLFLSNQVFLLLATS